MNFRFALYASIVLMLPPYIVIAAGFNQLHKRYNGTTYIGDLGLAVHSVVSTLRS